uniref:LIM domain only protein 7 n=1 Tax=Phallusia mammillata TaxID=59560 RepID=A0A6F9DJZ1_9ASCI|nr:LIM domain only protein 7 [Phallusia mammillata]
MSDHSRDSSYDAADDSRHRDVDDMMVRRTTGHMPAALRKKKQDDYKKFLTPTGDPMDYVRQHMRSKSMSDLQVDKQEKDQERDQRNVRYEEIQHVKEQLKEEEEMWTSKLQNWKTRRRSATLDALKRKEDRETIEHQQQQELGARRKPKTYREIVEDKTSVYDPRKRRELDFFDDDDPLNSGLPTKTSEADKNSKKKMPYRGAISVPNIRRAHKDSSSSDESSKESPKETKTVVQPVRYTSKVTAVINHVPAKTTDPAAAKPPTPVIAKVSPRSYSQVSPPQPKQTSSITRPINPSVPASASYNASRPRSQSPPSNSSTYSSQASVVMRRKKNADANRNKPRPKSDYGFLGSKSDRAQTLPRNYLSLNAPKPFEAPAASKFQQKRKTAFANKRNMWENMGQEKKDQPARPTAQHLSALLKHDNPHGEESNYRPQSYSHSEHSMSASQDSSSSVELSPRQQTLPPRQQSLPWEIEQKQNNPAPVVRNWSRSATLPNPPKPDPPVQPTVVEPVRNEPVMNGHHSVKPSEPKNVDPGPTFTVQSVKQKSVSPRAGTNASEPLFDDMKICINQRPRSEKGFGFTVRGGDDGKPVIVNTVSPGGAADICQLCVGDEILAINDVRLDSTLTQDGIVQLIVDSVITGNLSLDIRRYGKAKKTNPLRLSGTKVVMTPRGFVQVRSDKGKAPVVTTKMVNGNTADLNNEKENHSPYMHDDLPPPPDDLLTPPAAQDAPPQKQSAMSRLSPKQPYPKSATLPSSYRSSDPLSDLIQAAHKPSNPTQSESRPAMTLTSNTHVRPGRYSSYDDEDGTDDDDEVDYDVKRAQYELDVEQSFVDAERQRYDHDSTLRKQLMEEQRSLEEREAKREEEKRKRLEEARIEEMKLEEELRRIEKLKQQQQKRREEERRRIMEEQMPTGLHMKTATTNNTGGISHWLIEEAERARQADEDGRRRVNALDYTKNTQAAGTGALPDHVIQHLTKRNGPHQSQQRNSQASNAQLPETLTELWNDPNTQATLL